MCQIRMKSLFKKLLNRIKETLTERQEVKAVARLSGLIDLKSDNKASLFVVIAMPGCLHLTLCCISKLPPHRKVLVIANCCSASELVVLNSLGVIVHEIEGANMPHSRVIESLVKSLDEPFWLIDHDCFLMSDGFLTGVEEVVRNTNSIGATIFSEGCELGLSSQGIATFLMHFNPSAIREVQLAYDADFGVVTWKKLSHASEKKLRSIGLKTGMYPQKWKGYFDTLRLIDALAHGDGSQFIRSLSLGPIFHVNDVAVHLGQTSKVYWPTDVSQKKYAAFGAYGSKVLFETLTNFIDDIDGGDLNGCPSSSEMLAILIEANVISTHEVEFFDSLVCGFEGWISQTLEKGNV